MRPTAVGATRIRTARDATPIRADGQAPPPSCLGLGPRRSCQRRELDRGSPLNLGVIIAVPDLVRFAPIDSAGARPLSRECLAKIARAESEPNIFPAASDRAYAHPESSRSRADVI